jgi:hypothetical protein
MKLGISNYYVRGVYTFTRGIPQHYKDVHVVATSQEQAKVLAQNLQPDMQKARAIYVQRG